MKAVQTIAVAGLLFAANAKSDDRPEFDVATVKLSPPPPDPQRMPINLGTARNGMVTLTNASLADCLKFAYGIVSSDQLAGPDWIKTYEVRFDVVGQAPRDTPRDRLLLMLQRLLEDRLKLAMHHEQHELRYLALVVAKNGSKIHEAQFAPGEVESNPAMGGHISGKLNLQTIATLLSRFERETVVDATGLKGVYELDLQWTPAGRPDDGSRPSLPTALEEQLGLKLESRKGPLDVLVVDHAEKVPAEN